MKIANLLMLITLMITASCSSITEQVIVRMEGADKRPIWATLSQTTFFKNGILYSVGHTELPVNSRISMALHIADNNARLEIARKVQNDMAFIFQNIEEGLGESGIFSRFYGTEVSKLVSSGITQEKRYWEKIKTFDDDGESIYRLRVYSLVAIKEKDLKKMVKNVLDKKQEISPEIKQQIDKHITRELEKLATN